MKTVKPLNKGPSHRQLRVGELIRQALSEIFTRKEVYNQHLAKTLITISEVRMSADLKHAFVFISPFGQKFSKELKLALKNETPRLRFQVGKAIKLRNTPELHFEEDTSFEEAEKINLLLHSLAPSEDNS